MNFLKIKCYQEGLCNLQKLPLLSQRLKITLSSSSETLCQVSPGLVFPGTSPSPAGWRSCSLVQDLDHSRRAGEALLITGLAGPAAGGRRLPNSPSEGATNWPQFKFGEAPTFSDNPQKYKVKVTVIRICVFQ